MSDCARQVCGMLCKKYHNSGGILIFVGGAFYEN